MAEWIARQVTEALPWDDAPQYLIRDHDRIYGTVFTRRLRAMCIRDKPIAPASLLAFALERFYGGLHLPRLRYGRTFEGGYRSP
jgi:hypothetical protein